MVVASCCTTSTAAHLGLADSDWPAPHGIRAAPLVQLARLLSSNAAPLSLSGHAADFACCGASTGRPAQRAPLAPLCYTASLIRKGGPVARLGSYQCHSKLLRNCSVSQNQRTSDTSKADSWAKPGMPSPVPQFAMCTGNRSVLEPIALTPHRARKINLVPFRGLLLEKHLD